jgi:hypothetical protein
MPPFVGGIVGSSYSNPDATSESSRRTSRKALLLQQLSG